MSQDPDRLTRKVFDFCVGILLAAMALWAAVQIVASIWLAVSVGVLAIATIVGIVWVSFTRFRRW